MKHKNTKKYLCSIKNGGVYFKYGVFWLGVTFSLILISVGYLTENDVSISLIIVGFSIFMISTIVVAGYNYCHPIVWFNSVFYLYSISTPLLYVIGRYRYYPTYKEVLLLEFLAMVVFTFSAGTTVKKISWGSLDCIKNLKSGNSIFILITTLFIFIFIVLTVKSGVTSKLDKNLITSPWLKMDFLFTFFNVSLSIFIIGYVFTKNAWPKYAVFMVLLLYLVSFFYIGERDIIIRMIITGFILYVSIWKEVRFRIVVVASSFLIIFSTFLGLFKNFFISGELQNVEVLTHVDYNYTVKNIITVMLGSELRTASENLAILMQDVPMSIPYLYGQGAISEINSVFNIGFLMQRENIFNISNWFSSTYFPKFYESGGGAGFSLVGQGYIDGGVIGVILLFALLGVALRYIYNKSIYSPIFFVVYVNLIPIILISIRQTMALFLSQGFKHVLLPILIIMTISVVANKALKKS